MVVVLALGVATAAMDALLLKIASLYRMTSGLSLLAYRADKRATRRGAGRITEQTLHLLDLIGGWPRAPITQQRCHHKTTRQSFQTLFWLSVAANLARTAWLLTSGTAARLSVCPRSNTKQRL